MITQFNLIFLFFFISIQLILVIFFNKFAVFFGIYDQPDKIRKKHLIKTSLLGGSIIYLSLIFNNILFVFDPIFFETNNLFFKSSNQYLYFFVSCTFMFLIGIFDDLVNLNYSLKLFLTFVVILILVSADKSLLINEINLSFYPEMIDSSIISIFFTILCFLLFINAINMFDGIDGQVGLYSIFLILFIMHRSGLNVWLLIFLISFITFIFLNFKRKCFLGDGGTILIGFVFSYLLIKLYNYNIIYFADQIFLIMIIPGIDMLRLFVERIFSNRNPFKGDANHIHHLFEKNFGKYRSIFFTQILIILPVVFSIYFNLLMINFFTIILYFLIILVLKTYKRT